MLPPILPPRALRAPWLHLPIWIALLIQTPPALAVGARSAEEDGFEHFSQGELQSVAVTSDGYLLPTYERRSLGDTGAEVVWDAAPLPGGGYLCVTGHDGKLVRIDDNGATRSLGQPGDPELTALVHLDDRSFLIAGAPSGNIYRLDGDELTTAATLDASFVWRMVRDARGDVWAATGPEGRLFRLHPTRSGALEIEEIAKLESANLLDLWIDAEGAMGKPGELYIAGQDPGWLYRVPPDGKPVSVVFNAQAEEVRAIVPYGEGLALALNTERAPTPKALNLTLRMTGGQVSNGNQSQPQSPATPAEALKDLEKAFAASSRGGYGQPRSEVVVLGREGFVRQLWTASERPIHSLAIAPNGRVLVAAGDQGRLFEIDDRGELALVADVRDDYLLRVIDTGDRYLLAAARNGNLFAMDRARAGKAVFLSQAIDARLPVAWGHFYLEGNRARGQKIQVAFRSGNDGDVESEFWSDWSRDADVEIAEPVAMPAGPARFVQYRLKFQGDDHEGLPPRADVVELFYIEPNAAPMVAKVEVEDAADPRQARRARGGAPAQGGAPPPAPAADAKSGGNGAAAGGQRDARSNTMIVKVQWQAADPNGDPLRYALYFRGESEEDWKLIEDELTQNQLPIDVGGVADGRYRFRVVADDALGNPPGGDLSAEKVSDAVLIDNTPPRIEKLKAAVNGDRAVISLEGSDDLSILSALVVDIDNGDTLPVLPVDGLIDQRNERFEWQTARLKPGEHVATVVLTDRRGNSSVKKVLFTVDNP
jgi:hypothetical protein